MKLRYWFYLSALIFVAFAVEFDIAQRYQVRMAKMNLKNSDDSSPTASLKTSSEPSQMASIGGSTEVESESTTDNKDFINQFVLAAQKIARTVSDPKEIEEEIDQLAAKLTETDLDSLRKIMMDSQHDGDQRAMAIELLSRNKNKASLEVLNQFVSEYQPSNSTLNRQTEFETVLRAQAIEGIAAFPEKDTALNYLNQLTQKVDESFLKDRLMRSRENLLGRANAPEAQDNEALKKLIK